MTLSTPSDKPLYSNGWHSHDYPIVQLREEFRNLYRLVEQLMEENDLLAEELETLWTIVDDL